MRPKRSVALVGLHTMPLQRHLRAAKCVMQLMVEDLNAWWNHIERPELPSTFEVAAPKPPAIQPWGLRIAYVVHPSGVLWHITQRRPANLSYT